MEINIRIRQIENGYIAGPSQYQLGDNSSAERYYETLDALTLDLPGIIARTKDVLDRELNAQRQYSCGSQIRAAGNCSNS